MTKLAHPKQREKQLHHRIHLDLYQKIAYMAIEQDRSISWMATHLLERGFAEANRKHRRN